MTSSFLGSQPLLVFLVGLMVSAVSGCGGGSNSGVGSDPDGMGDGDLRAGQCEETIEGGIELTVPTRLVNSAANCDYLILGVVRINSKVLIQPGTRVRFGPEGGLNVQNGALTAIGTADNRIVFEGQYTGAGAWRGLSISGASEVASLHYVDLVDGGRKVPLLQSSAALTTANSSVDIKHTTISGSGGAGIDFKGGSVIVGFSENALSGNREEATIVDADQVAMLDSSSSFVGPNESDVSSVVRIRVGNLQGQGESVWSALDVPYEVRNVQVTDGTLVLAEGVTIAFTEFGQLSFTGSSNLQIRGLPDKPVSIQSLRGNDGSYVGLQFIDNGSKLHEIEHLILDGGGEPTQAIRDASINLGGFARLRLAQSVISNSDGWAIGCREGASLTNGPNNIFIDNRRGSIEPACAVQ